MENQNNATEDESSQHPFHLFKAGVLRNVGNEAWWTISTFKPGYGVDRMKEQELETFWHSNGPLPHTITLQFRRKTVVSDIVVYVDQRIDREKAPHWLIIKAGSTYNDLEFIRRAEFDDLEGWGWAAIPVTKDDKPLKTFLLQIIVAKNFGPIPDTIIRQLIVFSPVKPPVVPETICEFPSNFTTKEFLQYTTLR